MHYLAMVLGVCLVPLLQPLHAQSTTVFFDGEGPEKGITVPGACCFTYAGAEFFGFEGVFDPLNPALTASGDFSYRVVGSDLGLIITFDEPVDSVSFFFVHDPTEAVLIGFGFLLDSLGTTIDSFESHAATTPGDPENFIFSDPAEPVHSMRLFGLAAYVDNLTLTVNATASGAVPDGNDVPGIPLLLSKAAGKDITLSWSASCLVGDTDYAAYEGSLGDFTSHVPVSNPFCTTLGMTTATITPEDGGRYYVVVPQGTTREGSYGTDSGGAPRPASLSACQLQSLGTCR